MMWHDLSHDFRLACRNLHGSPVAAAVVIGTLALGIGANAAVFGAVDAVFLRPLPIADPARLAVMWESDPRRKQGVREVSHRNFVDWREQSRTFDGMAAMTSVTWSTLLDDRIDLGRVERAAVSGVFFELLGAQPLLGRTLRHDDDVRGAPRVVVLGHALWQQRFGGDAGVIGRSLRIQDQNFTVVGVMPRGFAFPAGAELWTAVVPAFEAARVQWKVDALENRSYGMLYVIGRLRPGVSVASARADLDAIVRRLSRFDGTFGSAPAVAVTPILDHMFGQTRRTLVLLLGMAGLVLAGVGANVSSLLLTRANVRRRDTAVKIALGASRRRVLREWLAETVLMTGIGTAAGLLLARPGLAALMTLAPSGIPRLGDAAIDLRAAGFACAVGALVSVLCAVAPAMHSWSAPLARRLKETRMTEGRQTRRTRRLLIASQVAIATALLFGAGLLVRSVANLQRLDLGFAPDRVLTLTVEPVVESTTRYRQIYGAILDRVAAVPGVQAVGAVYLRPLAHGAIGMDSGYLLEGQHIDRPDTWRHNVTLNFQAVTPGYFPAMQIQLLRGRLFTAADDERAPGAAIVSESTAERLWPGADPIGKRISIASGVTEDGQFPFQTVVGVVRDVRYRGLEDVRYDVYMPPAQTRNRVKHLMVRTASDPLATTAALRAAIGEVHPRVLIEHVVTMDDVVSGATAPWRFSMAMFVVLAILGVVLAAIGLFGLVAYSVTQRTPELAVRLAVGASPAQVLRLVLWEGGRLTGAGLAVGTALSLVLSRFVSSLLFRVEPIDPKTLLGTIVLLGGVTLLASYLAARRANSIEATAVLRGD